MVIELLLAGNGPGELAGWMAPVARAARAAAGPGEIRLTLILTPSQFASGREMEVVRGWSLFDRIVDPRAASAAALGVRPLARERHAALIHLGGDLWLSGRLAARMGVPAAAIAETPLAAARHRPFARIFAVSDQIAGELRRRGVPPEKVVVTGDPRRDAMPSDAARANAAQDGAPLISLLPGSRDRIFELIAPEFLKVAGALHRADPRVRFQIVASEFLSPRTLEEVRARARREWPDLPVQWRTSGGFAAAAAGDFALTIPGTNTLELAMLGVPFAVVVDLAWLDRAPMEGALEWLARVPLLGRALRRTVLRRRLARDPLIALPNIRLGRRLVPEWVGRWTPSDLANRVGELLGDRTRREALRAELGSRFGGPGGASHRIVEHAVALAERS